MLSGLLLMLGMTMSAQAQDAEDPHLWLEDVEGEEALDWAKARNAESVEAIASDGSLKALSDRLQSIYDSNERIAYPSAMGGYWYNFWRDEKNVRGVWRRTSPESYRSGEPEWETILDLDALAEAEGENWVWSGSSCLPPNYERCLISLSRGGADATAHDNARLSRQLNEKNEEIEELLERCEILEPEVTAPETVELQAFRRAA